MKIYSLIRSSDAVKNQTLFFSIESSAYPTAPPPASEPSEAKGQTLRHHPKPRLEPPFGKVPRIPKLHRKGHPKRSTYQSRTTFRVPFAVKFLESLEPSPKEGSKRGLGRRPKVFSPPTPPPSVKGSRRGAGLRKRIRRAGFAGSGGALGSGKESESGH